MSEALDFLCDLLDLETIEVNVYRGTHPTEERQRTFGGQVAAQALMAAGRTVERRSRPLAALVLPAPRRHVHPDSLRGRRHPRREEFHHPTGGRHPARQSDLQHAGQLSQRDELGVEHQIAMPDVPAPETIPTITERLKSEFGEVDEWFERQHPIDQRFIGELPGARPAPRTPTSDCGSRPTGSCPTTRCCTRAWSPTPAT